MTGESWAPATIDGARRAHQQDIARATATQRMAWLEEALRLAAALGALARVRRERQQACDARWTSAGAAS